MVALSQHTCALCQRLVQKRVGGNISVSMAIWFFLAEERPAVIALLSGTQKETQPSILAKRTL